MFDDGDYSVMREAGIVVDSVDDGEWWIEALRGEVSEEVARRKSAAGNLTGSSPRVRAGKPGRPKKPQPPAPEEAAQGARLQALRDAHAKAQAAPRCSECGKGDREISWKGMCRSCYDKTRTGRDRGTRKDRKCWEVSYGNFEPVFRMVQEMAKQERRSVSDMVMVLVADSVARKIQDCVAATKPGPRDRAQTPKH